MYSYPERCGPGTYRILTSLSIRPIHDPAAQSVEADGASGARLGLNVNDIYVISKSTGGGVSSRPGSQDGGDGRADCSQSALADGRAGNVTSADPEGGRLASSSAYYLWGETY